MRTSRRLLLAASGLLLATIATAGCAPTSPQDETPAASSQPAGTPAASGSSAPSAAPTEEPSAWPSFATDDGEIAFRHPADWTLAEIPTDPAVAGPDGSRRLDAVELTAPNGQMLLGIADSDAVDFGGACGTNPDGSVRVAPLEVLASEPIGTAAGETAIATVALGTLDGRWTVGVGLVDPADLEVEETCLVRFLTSSSQGLIHIATLPMLTVDDDDPLRTVASLDAARSYLGTDEHATLLEILRSVELG